jgi:hypothetical protein
MFADPITLAGDGGSTRNYGLRTVVDGKSVRANASAPAAEPETLTIAHSTTKRLGITYDRHLVRADLGKTSVSSPGTPVSASVQVVVEVPRDTIMTVAMVRDMRTQIQNFWVNANLDKILNSEP